MPDILICPLCQSPLHVKNQQLYCEHKHSFDKAKEGYVNLLSVQHKRSKEPGDNKQMLHNRQQFLDSGHYQPLADQLASYINERVATKTILDIGCGEGFYTHQLKNSRNQVWGCDISKEGIKYAAKHYKSCQFVVASNQRLPFATESLDVITRVFAPQHDAEVIRCLHPRGQLITVVPGPWHLKQLRQYIYTDLRAHNNQPQSIDGLQLKESINIQYTMLLSPTDRERLMGMTPFSWKLTPSIRAQFTHAQEPVEAQFTLHIYQHES
ncbi:23S rRNA (guanine(745)-N(1))-methyltransferase [Celerinatantimonas diazotrophica]|uniref:23S rRNA m(1)G-745 methyltransferase n=1 Tax=Celerinatantimonas diazotrophica TaxID=412034 RepID=A0A4R1JLJ5_9GAMM|nr:23S rRNA (guanine(745)-N(1))-methyltransferase [Celerinatantimonas diazotrophica]TCK51903.1 23S rRNA m(1)G-745 methyltransferase [Celerinatantimonas diazotrophica]CAG9296401.1 23S rRNA (guanine(745)-N(1))-methyltransferase [Celerinatantimonas diazotrophica]